MGPSTVSSSAQHLLVATRSRRNKKRKVEDDESYWRLPPAECLIPSEP